MLQGETSNVWLCRHSIAAIKFDDVVVQVQTIKTSVESAIMLLRIDDIVSGISKKKGAPSGPTGTQTEDHDNVSIAMHTNPFACASD